MASECSGLAEAWLVINESQRANAMREMMVRSSFQIGYRKDHQLEAWLHLAGFLLADEPDNLLKTLRWFSKCIAGLDWTVETRTVNDAASALINVCARVHPEQAFTYFKCFGGKQLLWPEDALVNFLMAAVLHTEAALDEIIVTICRFVLPTFEHGNCHLMERLVVKIFTSMTEDSAFERFGALRAAVAAVNGEAKEQWSYGLARGALLSSIDLKTVDLSSEILSPKGYGSNANNLVLEEETLTIDELEFANLTLEKLIGLRRSAPAESIFNWHRLITRIASQFNKVELLAIAEEFRGDRKFILIVEAVSDRLIELDGKDELRTLVSEALSESHPDGWSRFYDGGTRLGCFNLLYKTDKIAALKLLYEDCADHQPLSIGNLQHLLPLIATYEQRLTIWSEIREYLGSLLEGFDHADEEPPQLPQSGSPLGDQFSAALLGIFGR